MSKELKRLRKDAKKLAKRINSDKRLTLSTSFDSNFSLHKKGRDSAPLVTVSAKGDYSFSILKLFLTLLAAGTAVGVSVLLLRDLADKLHEKRIRRRIERLEAEAKEREAEIIG